ncbi:putative RNA-directed DNA polymerase [Helianthus annuus]|nr:putative RNA-directed DNA polymerase [Helianthus annuus]
MVVSNHKVLDKDTFTIWHDRLGHPGNIMMRRIIKSANGHPLKNLKVLLSQELSCAACSLGKLITRPSQTKLTQENPSFLERIQGDICGPIHPPCGPFRYFLVLIDASSRWSHVSLLATRNVAFSRLLAQIIQLRAHFPENPIKTIRVDNAGEFTSQAFNDYCMSIGIKVEHPVAHVHTQNGLAESLIKRLQIIARPLLMRCKLPSSAWGHAILHAAALIRLRPTADHEYSPLQLVSGREPNLSHLKIFGCAVYVPISPPQRTIMGPQRRLGIYIGFNSPSIIKYLEPLTGDMFTARFADCQFNETVFPVLGGDKTKERLVTQELTWNASSLSNLDPRSGQCESEVQKIIHLQRIANELPDAFTDTNRVTKSHIPASNAPARIEVIPEAINIQRKRGRPIGSKDKNPRKRKEQNKSVGENLVNETIEEVNVPEETNITPEENENPEDTLVPNENEISINYVQNSTIWNRNETRVNDIFAYAIATDVINENDYIPKTLEECMHRVDWPKWQEAIKAELGSLEKRNVFGPVVRTPIDVKPVGYKWVFAIKRNEKNEIVRYKARLVAQGFSQIPGVDYEETYSPVVDAITLRFLIGLAISEGLQMRLMDVVTAYLYGTLENDIYMKIPKGLKMPEALKSIPRDMCAIKLKRSLYGLKQSGRMWYNRLSEYLEKEGYKSDIISPCVFIKRSLSKFTIIAVYVDDINIIGAPEEIEKTANILKREFEMKDLGTTKLCLGLQFEHLRNGTFIHQSNYIQKMLVRFNMDKAHPFSIPMVVRPLDPQKDPFRPQEEGEEVLGPEVPYLSAIGALMYLANNTRPDIAFSVHVLARYSSNPTRRHWNGIKHIFRYICGTQDLGLFYQKDQMSQLVGYADAGYLSDPHKAKSQTGYVFTYGGTAISWKSTKQTLTATSSNHAELIALYEAGRECVWLRSMITHIQEACGLEQIKKEPTIIYEDNAACIAQIKEGYIKGDRTKHISPKFFSTYDLQKEGEIDVCQIKSSENLADLFTKSLPRNSFEQLSHKIGLRRLKDVC